MLTWCDLRWDTIYSTLFMFHELECESILCWQATPETGLQQWKGRNSSSVKHVTHMDKQRPDLLLEHLVQDSWGILQHPQCSQEIRPVLPESDDPTSSLRMICLRQVVMLRKHVEWIDEDIGCNFLLAAYWFTTCWPLGWMVWGWVDSTLWVNVHCKFYITYYTAVLKLEWNW